MTVSYVVEMNILYVTIRYVKQYSLEISLVRLKQLHLFDYAVYLRHSSGFTDQPLITTSTNLPASLWRREDEHSLSLYVVNTW